MYNTIPEDTIQQIIRQVDIVEVVGDYVQLKKSGKNHLGLCPFHSEKTPSFSVSADKQLYYCFGCGAGGNAFTFLMEMEGYSFTEAVRYLGPKAGIDLAEDVWAASGQQEKQDERDLVLKAHHLAMQLFHHVLTERKEGQQGLDYLQQRGIKAETIKHFQLGYAPQSWDFLTRFLEKRKYPLSLMAQGGLLVKKEGEDRYFDRFRDRMMIPIWNRQGQVIAFQGRIVGQGEPKYLNSPETFLFQKHRQLFHFHRARKDIRHQQTAVLFEGCMDVLTAWQEGIVHATAALGTSMSEEQARMIARNAEQVIICYDSDQAGIEATAKTAQMLLEHHCLVKVAVLPQGLDPDEYIRKHGVARFKDEMLGQARSFTAFQLEVLRRGRDLQDDTERMAYIREALTFISRLDQAIERDHYLRQLADEFTLSVDALKQEFYKIRRAEKKSNIRDKGVQKWHNSKNQGKHLVARQLLPAHQQAEKILLAHMLTDENIAKRIEQEIGGDFHVELHSVLAAYIYTFYQQGHTADIGLFLTTLQDPALIQLASELSTMTINPDISERELHDLITQIHQYALQLEMEKKMKLQKAAERRGDEETAVQLAMEVVNMRKNWKQLQNRAVIRGKEGE